MLFLVSLLKAYGEVLVLCMAARGVLRLLRRERAEQGLVFHVLSAVIRPWPQLARGILPRTATVRQIEGLAAIAAVVFWVAASTQKAELCRADAARTPACREYRQFSPP